MLVETVGEVAVIGNYYAFHRSTDTALVNRFQRAFDAIAPQRNEISHRYGISTERMDLFP
jgi:hypothetical protein